MRKPLDICPIPNCGGILIIARHKPPGPRYDGATIVGGRHFVPEYKLTYLFCAKCGIMVHAKDANQELKELRRESWMAKHHPELSAVPTECPHCNGKELGKDTVMLKNVGERKRNRSGDICEGIFCVLCNSTLGHILKTQ